MTNQPDRKGVVAIGGSLVGANVYPRVKEGGTQCSTIENSQGRSCLAW
jgi:hypothetical protein